MWSSFLNNMEQTETIGHLVETIPVARRRRICRDPERFSRQCDVGDASTRVVMQVHAPSLPGQPDEAFVRASQLAGAERCPSSRLGTCVSAQHSHAVDLGSSACPPPTCP